jgi:signal transduction histidine kinase
VENLASARLESSTASVVSGHAAPGTSLAWGKDKDGPVADQELALKKEAPRDIDGGFKAKELGDQVLDEANLLGSLDRSVALATPPMPSEPAPAGAPASRLKQTDEVVFTEKTRQIQPAKLAEVERKSVSEKGEVVRENLHAEPPQASAFGGGRSSSGSVLAEGNRSQADSKPTARPISQSAVDRLDNLSWNASEKKEGDTRDLAAQSVASGEEVVRDQAVSLRLPSLRSAWRPWNWENSFFLLGFVEDSLRRQIFGVELELLALLARLPAALDGGSTAAFVLRDQLGSTYFQSRPVARTETPVDVFSLGPALPFFELAVFPADPASFARLGRGSFVAMALLVGVFLAAIASGGGLLIAQTRRSWKEAMQKTSFVSNVSHELKTPLTTLRMYTELLRGGKVTGEKQTQYLNVMLTEGERLSRLVSNVLDFSRLEEGRKKYQRETYDLGSQVEQVVEGARLAFERPELSLTMVPADGPLMVNTDRDAVEQIMLNLLDNATKYGGAGGEIRVVTDSPRGKPRIRVMDRGPGVSHDQRERIFEKFHRVDNSLTATQGGCGLGLSIARRLARDLGGDLRYENRPGGGAVFLLELPAAEKEPA